ncbi:MAG: hypothetical protein JMDDDDMK_03308 [Acidobacteria bacterium]|nr:hypothetical protein [Acidobacteriota bacterium]
MSWPRTLAGVNFASSVAVSRCRNATIGSLSRPPNRSMIIRLIIEITSCPVPPSPMMMAERILFDFGCVLSADGSGMAASYSSLATKT